jgi:hypothetical protein
MSTGQTGYRPLAPQTVPGRFVTDELRADDFESHWAPEVGIDRLVGDSHAAMPELQRLSVLTVKDVVMLETKLRRGI